MMYIVYTCSSFIFIYLHWSSLIIVDHQSSFIIVYPMESHHDLGLSTFINIYICICIYIYVYIYSWMKRLSPVFYLRSYEIIWNHMKSTTSVNSDWVPIFSLSWQNFWKCVLMESWKFLIFVRWFSWLSQLSHVWKAGFRVVLLLLPGLAMVTCRYMKFSWCNSWVMAVMVIPRDEIGNPNVMGLILIFDISIISKHQNIIDIIIDIFDQ